MKYEFGLREKPFEFNSGFENAEDSLATGLSGTRQGKVPQESSDYIRWVQACLNRLMNVRLPLTGVMGAQTRSAVRSFQERQGLPITGLVGPDTERALQTGGGAKACTLIERRQCAHQGRPHGLSEADRYRPGQGDHFPHARSLTMFEPGWMQADTPQLEVIQPDTRRRVSKADTTSLPYRWICYLREPNADPSIRSYGMGTGVLVGPRHVLTSAHVLVSEKDPSKTVSDRLRVQPARNGDHQPFPEVKIRGWRVDPRWIRKVGRHWRVQTRFDYGLVVLEKDVSGWKHPGLGVCSLAYWGAADICFPQTEVGLAADKVSGQSAWSAGYPGDRTPGTMYGGAGNISYDNRQGVLLHTIDTYRGQSGAPIWIKRHGMWCLVGIHSRGGRWAVVGDRTVPTHNAAVLLSFDLLRQVEAWKRSFGA